MLNRFLSWLMRPAAKFNEGQRVAVCAAPDFPTVIPVTTVIGRRWIEKGYRWADRDTGKTFEATRGGWVYLVHGCDTWNGESYLRSYFDGDYDATDDEVTKERQHG